jgi:hypothetical protein
MPRKPKPHEQRKPEDYRQAEDWRGLAEVLAGQGGVSDRDFLRRMAGAVWCKE